MKKIILILLFIPLVSFSQNKDGVELCLAAQEFSKNFINDEKAENALEKILSVIGASKNFNLQQCDDINNALAITYKGDRYILYDKNFMKLITDYTDDWSSMFILAHEVGHHINGHTRDAALGTILDETTLEKQRQEELEADKFAGFVLAKLGASLDQTVAAVNLVSTNEDDLYLTHPNKNKRLEAINFGYNSSLPKIADKETSIDESKSKTTITKSSSGWQYIENNISEKFEEREIEKEVLSFGKIIPNTVNNLNKNPKISIKKARGPNKDVFFITISNINIPLNENYSLKIDDNWKNMNFNARKEVFKYLNQYSFESTFLPFEEKSNSNEWCLECPSSEKKEIDRSLLKFGATIELSNSNNQIDKWVSQLSISIDYEEMFQSLMDRNWKFPKDESLAGAFTINNNNIESISFYIHEQSCNVYKEGYNRVEFEHKGIRYSMEELVDEYKRRGLALKNDSETINYVLQRNPEMKKVITPIPIDSNNNICWLLNYDKLDIKIEPINYRVEIYSPVDNASLYFNFLRDIEKPNEYLSFDLSGLNKDLINLFN